MWGYVWGFVQGGCIGYTGISLVDKGLNWYVNRQYDESEEE